MPSISNRITTSEFSNAERSYSPRKRQTRASANTTIWLLLLLSALGPIFSDVLLLRLGGFAFTLPHLLLVVATAAVFGDGRRINERFLAIWYTMVMVEIFHALVAGFAADSEWRKSFSQFIAYGGCFVLLTSFRLDRATLRAVAPWTLKLGVLMG